MIQILQNKLTGKVGWRIGDEGQVFQGGALRHDNGQWEIEDEVNDPEEALDYLSEEDVLALIEATERLDAEVEAAEARKSSLESQRAADLDAFVKDMPTAPYDKYMKFDGRIFVRDSRLGRICYVFRKKGGTRNWHFPVSLEELRGIITGTHGLRYQVGGNAAKIVKL